ncbi:uncharacterized protein PAN0_034c6283 [Moesziomyces antarcticus]|uniref:Uncharacterized protein n=1 Tax=Pseudozyma antarctica TaxID=84753 RepID=A0A081CN06_PSEA2|nr:uncharacterized protein PAN0_034c6283 [Moesziomyces antarcticus]GAK68052.1 hypothetical protein PAN0_034c6283 [Moesziomyces antarcticus]
MTNSPTPTRALNTRRFRIRMRIRPRVRVSLSRRTLLSRADPPVGGRIFRRRRTLPEGGPFRRRPLPTRPIPSASASRTAVTMRGWGVEADLSAATPPVVGGGPAFHRARACRGDSGGRLKLTRQCPS